MTLNADIVYRNVPASGWLDGEIQKHVARLRSYCADILSCKVLVEIPHRHHEHGNHIRVRIDMTVPGDKLVAGAEAVPKDAATAFRRALAAAKRELQDYARRRRHQVKTHPRARSRQRVDAIRRLHAADASERRTVCQVVARDEPPGKKVVCASSIGKTRGGSWPRISPATPIART